MLAVAQNEILVRNRLSVQQERLGLDREGPLIELFDHRIGDALLGTVSPVETGNILDVIGSVVLGHQARGPWPSCAG